LAFVEEAEATGALLEEVEAFEVLVDGLAVDVDALLVLVAAFEVVEAALLVEVAALLVLVAGLLELIDVFEVDAAFELEAEEEVAVTKISV